MFDKDFKIKGKHENRKLGNSTLFRGLGKADCAFQTALSATFFTICPFDIAFFIFEELLFFHYYILFSL